MTKQRKLTSGEPLRHVCGLCGEEWLTEDEYNSHLCPSTSVTPGDMAHFGDDFKDIARAALERGLETLKKEKADPDLITDQEAAISELQA